MINQIHLERFKCFDSQEIDLSNLSILAGSNGSGKSTIIQSLLLLRQSFFKQELSTSTISLNGALVNIGSIRDARFTGSKEDSIAFSITSQNGETDFNAVYDYSPEKMDWDILRARESPTINRYSNIFKDKFSYLHAERISPKSIYAIRRSDIDTTSVGIHGEFSIDQLSKNSEDSLIIPGLAFPDREAQDSFQVGYNAREWMRYIFPGLDWQINRYPEADSVTITFKNLGGSEYFRPSNTGFGISYTLPIIIAGLISIKDSIFIIENPESHLHPAGQSAMGRFLAHLAANGIQVIVETHSDHILNGIRLAVKQHILITEQVIINFFVRNDTESPSQVEKLEIKDNGQIQNWPDGFFDQTEKDLMQLF